MDVYNPDSLGISKWTNVERRIFAAQNILQHIDI
jgi:hypothetical protein